jgi:hypothetical protein
VMNGFAIEIEDRGLGLTPERLAELNNRLANPPDVNPANTEQLGLFVVAQLGRRHGIQVTLRTSPYGGTTAVTLIPRRLVVDDAPAALTSGENPAVKSGAGQGGQRPALPSFQPAGADGGSGLAASGGFPATGNGHGNGHAGATRPGFSPNGNDYSRGPQAGNAAGYGNDAGAGSPPDLGSIPIGGYQAGGYQSGSYQTGSYPSGNYPAVGQQATGYPASGSPVSGGFPSGGYSQDTPVPPAGAGADPRRGRYSDEVPVVTGIPVSKDAAPPFDVFTPVSRPDGDVGYAPGTGGLQGPTGGAYTRGGPAYPPGDGDPESANGTYQAAGYGNIIGDGTGVAELGENEGLPRRVRQASLAPQLRDAGARNSGPVDTEGPQPSAASLNDMRNTLSAMQRGWQQGRSQSPQRDTEGK